MGQTYWVTLQVKVNDEDNATKALQKYLERFSWLSEMPTTFEDCIKVMLAEHQHDFQKEMEDDFTVYKSGFDASYGWESVLDEMFKAMKPYVAKGSKITVYPDSGHWTEVA